MLGKTRALQVTKKKTPLESQEVGHFKTVDVIFSCLSNDFLQRHLSMITHIDSEKKKKRKILGLDKGLYPQLKLMRPPGKTPKHFVSCLLKALTSSV